MIPRYEVKFNIVCYLHTQNFNIYKYLFWVPFLIWKRRVLLGLVSFHFQTLVS